EGRSENLLRDQERELDRAALGLLEKRLTLGEHAFRRLLEDEARRLDLGPRLLDARGVAALARLGLGLLGEPLPLGLRHADDLRRARGRRVAGHDERSLYLEGRELERPDRARPPISSS